MSVPLDLGITDFPLDAIRAVSAKAAKRYLLHLLPPFVFGLKSSQLFSSCHRLTYFQPVGLH